MKSNVRREINRRYSPMGFALLLSLSGCGGDSSGPKPTVTWEGTITSAATGSPVAGASVQVGDGTGFVPAIIASGTSDAQGHYSISHQGCVRNPYLFAGANGYVGYDKPVACHAGTITVNIALTPSP